MKIEESKKPLELDKVENNLPQISSYSQSSPMKNFMDSSFKSRTSAPKMLLGLRTKKRQEIEFNEYT